MTPAPTLEQLIASTKADVNSNDPLELLAEASRTGGEMEDIADALVGHFVDECRRAGHTWSEISSALGVSKQAVHKRYSAGAPSFERFTERARMVLRSAVDVARQLGHGYVGTEHLLLALFGPPEGISAKVLAEAGLTRAQCEEALKVALTAAAPGAGVGGGAEPGTATRPRPAPDESIPWTPRAADVLRAAVAEALAMGHNYIGTEHMLLGLFRVRHGLALEVLQSLGADEAAIRLRVQEHLVAFQKARGQSTAEQAGS
ncbi:MAG: Clp protease N-terminal domain-containing protein [Acidimicrobiales bacterium]